MVACNWLLAAVAAAEAEAGIDWEGGGEGRGGGGRRLAVRKEIEVRGCAVCTVCDFLTIACLICPMA